MPRTQSYFTCRDSFQMLTWPNGAKCECWKSEEYLVYSLPYRYEVSWSQWSWRNRTEFHILESSDIILDLTSVKLKAHSHLAEYCQEERSWWAANICFWKQSRNDAEARFLQSFVTILQTHYVGQGTRQ